MEWIEDQLNHAPAPSAIVHLGAGLCRELPHYIGSGAGRIILFEPNPGVVPALRRQAEGHSNVEVFPVAVAAEPGRRALKLYNYDDLASLRRPTGLFELLPGLQHAGQAIVDVMAAHKLASELRLESEENNWLIIDTPGEEAAIISALEQHKQLHHFDRIIIRAGAESLYDGAPSAEQLTRQLEQLGYYIEGAKDTSDCDWPRYHLRLNPKAIECRRLKRENDALTEQKTTLEKQNQELTEQLQRQVGRSKKHAEELEAAQQQAREQEKELKVRNKELQGKLQEAENSCQQTQKQAKELEGQNDDLNSRLEKLAEEKTTLEKQNQKLIDQLEQQKGEAKKRTEELEAAQQQAQQQEKDLKAQHKELQAQIEKLKKSLSEVKTAKEHYEQLASEQSRQLEDRQREQKDLDERQRLLDSEMQRAEAQIDLMKDVLIREKNF